MNTIEKMFKVLQHLIFHPFDNSGFGGAPVWQMYLALAMVKISDGLKYIGINWKPYSTALY